MLSLACRSPKLLRMMPTFSVMIRFSLRTIPSTSIFLTTESSSRLGSPLSGNALIFAASWAADAPKTNASRRLLLANRFAPWTPVFATSPAAYNLGIEDLPARSVVMPPH